MFGKKTAFTAKRGDMEIACRGFSAKEIVSFLNVLTTAEENDEVDPVVLKQLFESKGDLNEVVDSGDGKDIEMVQVGKPKLPNCTSSFTCPSCRQSILLYNNNKILVYNVNDKKLYAVGEVQLPDMRINPGEALSEIDMDKVIAVYKDCLSLINNDNSFVLVSDSTEECQCPVCGNTGDVATFVKYHEYNYNDGETCDICGCEKDNVITQDGGSSDCKNHCIEKLGEK